MGSAPYRHWREQTDAAGVCRLTLDKAESNTNTLSSDVLRELDLLLDALTARANLAGLIIQSSKASGFVAGADVNEFTTLDSEAEAAAAAARGQAVMRRIAALPCPTVAAINGYALGGGLELALACDYRVAVEAYERTLGLPEVQLGIHPGFGGTVRAVEVMGPIRGLEMMLTGRSLSPVEAKAAGLVDALAATTAELDAVAARMIATRPPQHRPPWYLRALNLRPLRPLVARRLRARVARRARPEQYPAPYAIVDLWLRHGAHGDAAYRAEVESIGRLLVGRTCKNLVRLFLLRERLRNLAPKRDEIRRVHIIGAGVMGGDIAAWCALRGLSVSLQDRGPEFVEPALERAEKLFAKRLKAPGAAAAAKQRLEVDIEGARLPDADIVIEAIVEDRDIKRRVFAETESAARPEAILASNTSSIRIEEIAGSLRDPHRLVGVHFFNPVAQLPLVEVIRGEATSESVVTRALSFVTQIGKLPLPCRSSPGFLVNRILMPYMLEALTALEEGHARETIDAAAKRFGMPTGPIELADRVGLDVALHVATILAASFGRQPPDRLRAKVEAGELGAKTGAGFYEYTSGRAVKAKDHPPPDEDLCDRLILSLVNEAVACFEDEVVDDLDLLDAGVVFGTGFAPHTGGPIHYARERGFTGVEQRLRDLSTRFGPRFEPSHGWARLIAAT